MEDQLSSSLKFQRQVNQSLLTFRQNQKQADTNKTPAVCSLYIHDQTISVREVAALGVILARQLPPETPIGFRLSECVFEDASAEQSFQEYVSRLPNPVVKLALSNTKLSLRALSAIMDKCAPHLKSVTITLGNDNENGEGPMSELWKCKGCQTLENLTFTTGCKPLDTQHVKEALQGLDHNNLPNLAMLRLQNFSCSDKGVGLVVEGALRLASACKKFQVFEFDFDCGSEDDHSLTSAALGPLSELGRKLPKHVVLGVSLWNSIELFRDASPCQVEDFLGSLRHRSLSEFMLDSVGLRSEQAKLIFHALETMGFAALGPKYDGGDGDPFILISGDHILDDEEAVEQLIESVPRMPGIADVMIENTESIEGWSTDRDKQLLQALEQNPWLRSLSVTIFYDDRLSTNLDISKAHDDIIKRNVALGKTVPKALGTVEPGSPPGWIAELLKPSVLGCCKKYNADPAYRILRHEAANIWK